MTALFTLSIPGDPVGKGRPRMAVVAGHAMAYTPKPTAQWEGMAASLARAKWHREPLDEAVAVLVLAVASRPKRLLRKRDPDGRMWRTSKPDIDNVAKAVLDALVKAGVIRDDTLVVSLSAQSLYASRVEGPCVELVLRTVGVEVHVALPAMEPHQDSLFATGAG
jgi:Holliday junction resolvase RusA-like endonuclease